MGEYVAVEGVTLVFDPPTVQGVISIISTPSTVEKIGGKGVYSGPLIFSCSSLVLEDCGTATYGKLTSGVINPTAISMKAGGEFVIREGDESGKLESTEAQKPWQNKTIDCVIQFRVKVKSAGQTYVIAD